MVSELDYTINIELKHLGPEGLSDDKELLLSLENIVVLAKEKGIDVRVDKYPEITSDLIDKVGEYFTKTTHLGYEEKAGRLKLKRLEISTVDSDIIYAVTGKVPLDLKRDSKWEEGLENIGEELGVFLRVNYSSED